MISIISQTETNTECAHAHSQLVQPCLTLCDRQAPLSMGFSRQNTGVGCHFFLQGIFPTQESNLDLLWVLHCRQILQPWAIREALNTAWYHLNVENFKNQPQESRKAVARSWGRCNRKRLVKGYKLSAIRWIRPEDLILIYNLVTVVDNTLI